MLYLYALIVGILISSTSYATIIEGALDKAGRFQNVAKLELGVAGASESELYVCTGTVISDRTVLTAGHCLYGLRADPHTSIVKINGAAYRASTFHFADGFLEGQKKYLSINSELNAAVFGTYNFKRLETQAKKRFLENAERDLALIITEGPIDLTVPRTKLRFTKLKEKSAVVAVGYGYTQFELGAPYGGYSGQTDVPYFRNELSSASPNSTYAIQNPSAKYGVTSPGDSGSPLLISKKDEHEQVGILSGLYSARLGAVPISLYTNLRKHRRFIRKNLQR